MPAVISAGIFFVRPSMARHGGLSAVNLGPLVFLASRGRQGSWFDWLWPTALAVYVAEAALEPARRNGRAGGMNEFDDPPIRVAAGPMSGAPPSGFPSGSLGRR